MRKLTANKARDRLVSGRYDKPAGALFGYGNTTSRSARLRAFRRSKQHSKFDDTVRPRSETAVSRTAGDSRDALQKIIVNPDEASLFPSRPLDITLEAENPLILRIYQLKLSLTPEVSAGFTSRLQRAMFRPFRPWSFMRERLPGPPLRQPRLSHFGLSARFGEKQKAVSKGQKVESRKVGDGEGRKKRTGGRREAVMRCFGPSVFRCGTTPSLGCLFH